MIQIKYIGLAGSLIGLVVLGVTAVPSIAGAVARSNVDATPPIADRDQILLAQQPSQPPASDPNRTSRINDYKTKLKPPLTPAQAKNIQGRCKAAQTKVGQLTAGLDKIESSRELAYGRSLNRFSQLAERIKAENSNVVAYKKQVTLYRSSIVTFKNDFAQYRTAIDDLAKLDCVNDPTGFKATLEIARGLRQQLLADSAAINKQASTTAAALKLIKAEG